MTLIHPETACGNDPALAVTKPVAVAVGNDQNPRPICPGRHSPYHHDTFGALI